MNTTENEMIRVLNARLKKLDKIERILLNQIQENQICNDTMIKVCVSRGISYWYKKDKESDTYKIVNDKATIRRLVQNSYNKKSIVYIQKEINSIRKTLDSICTYELEKLLGSTHKSRQEFIAPIKFELTDEEFIANFYKTPQCTLGFKEDDPIILTKKGLRVRSKSEASIADCMDEYNIPFLFEPEIIINGIKVHPDFVCLNLRTRTIYVWEHFGAVGDKEYANYNAVPKFWSYVNAGYQLGRNLIITLESEKNPFYGQQADMVIKQFLL